MIRTPTRKALVAANARFGAGGQGQNFLDTVSAYQTLPGWELEVFGQDGAEDSRQAALGERYHAVPTSRTVKLWRRIPWLRRFRDGFVSLGERDFDRKVSRMMSSGDAFHGVTGQCLASLKRAKRLGLSARLDVITAHIDVYGEVQREECRRFGVRPAIGSALSRRMREEYETADEIRVMSHVAARMFQERSTDADKVFVAHPPLTDDALLSAAAAAKDERFVVAFVGLLEPAKGFHYLVEAFERLEDADARLEIWGMPGARPVDEYIRSRIGRDARISLMPGRVRDAGYDRVYGRASVLAHPSLADGFGYVVAEAMACGTPAIVTENTGAADLVEDGVNGFVVPIRDSDALYERLRWMGRNRDRIAALGERARSAARELTLENYARRLNQGAFRRERGGSPV